MVDATMLDHSTSTPIALRPTLPASTDTVLTALRGAADQTGTDFDYLLNTAMRESSLNPDAKAASSSATGLFQFVEQTWLGTMQSHGAQHGFARYADAIKLGKDGHFTVADKGLRQEILAQRKDPKTSALMAGELTNDMRGDMETALGRGVSAGELYVAHFLGPQAAVKMIKAAGESPAAAAAKLFTDAAAANQSIFYQKNGQARSVASVLETLKAKHQGTQSMPRDFAAATQTATRPTQVHAQALRGSFDVASFVRPPTADSFVTGFGDNSMMMSPLIAQLLSAADRMPGLAAAFRPDDEPELRATTL